MEKRLGAGRRISGKRVSEDTYLQFYEFLMFDPLYREMHDKAKVLYTFLRSKVSLFEKKQKEFEDGVEGSKSYLDENGDIFIIADNSELMYLLNTSEPTVIKMKKELHKYGLLDEVPVKHKTNRIYVLLPNELSDKWAYVGEIMELREKREQERKEKNEKVKLEKVNASKEKRNVASSLDKREKLIKANVNIGIAHDLKNLSHEKESSKINDLNNLSHDDLKNFSYDDLNNLSESYSKVFKLTLIPESESNRFDDDEKNLEGFQINNFAFQEFANHFHENYEWDNTMFQLIYEQMLKQQLDLFTIKEAERQARRMKKWGHEKINDYPAYFVGGIMKNRTSENGALTERRLDIERIKAEEGRTEKVHQNKPKKVPFYNWLVERDDERPIQKQKETVPPSLDKIVIDDGDLPF